MRTMVSYVTHPLVVHAVLLEHGCEKTHNGRLEQDLQEAVSGVLCTLKLALVHVVLQFLNTPLPCFFKFHFLPTGR